MTGVRWADWITPGDLVVDVGANVGTYTAAFLAAGARVVAFEPDPDVATQCRLRAPAADVRAVAVGQAEGATTLYRCASSPRSSRYLVNAEKGTPIPVPVVTLDEALGGRVIQGLKVDAQGDDGWVLAGARETLWRMPQGAWLLCELWPAGLQAAQFDCDRLATALDGWAVVAWGKAYSETAKTIAEILDAVRDWRAGRHTNVLLRKVAA